MTLFVGYHVRDHVYKRVMQPENIISQGVGACFPDRFFRVHACAAEEEKKTVLDTYVR